MRSISLIKGALADALRRGLVTSNGAVVARANLKWPDIDFTRKRLHLNRGLVAVGCAVHQTRGKTKNARRAIALDDATLTILAGWRASRPPSTRRSASPTTTGGCSPTVMQARASHSVYEAFRQIVHNAGVPTIRFNDLRHTHGSLLIQDGTPVKVVSERLDHANIAFPMQTYLI